MLSGDGHLTPVDLEGAFSLDERDAVGVALALTGMDPSVLTKMAPLDEQRV